MSYIFPAASEHLLLRIAMAAIDRTIHLETFIGEALCEFVVILLLRHIGTEN